MPEPRLNQVEIEDFTNHVSALAAEQPELYREIDRLRERLAEAERLLRCFGHGWVTRSQTPMVATAIKPVAVIKALTDYLEEGNHV